MMERDLITQDSKERPKEVRRYCEFHANGGHDIQECSKFRSIVQNLMDNKEIKFYEEIEGSKEGEVYASKKRTTEEAQRVNHPVVIISRPKNNEAGVQMVPRVIIQKPVSFPYKDSKMVPWNYDYNVMIPGRESSANVSRENQNIGFYTRSGRRYDPASTETKTVKEKTPIAEQRKEKTVRFESPINKPVTEKEAREFLKFLKHSEYSVVEQLHKQPARISVLALLLSSETHRSALMKVLNETYVTNDISVNKLDRLVNNISTDNFIFFNDDEIPPGGMGSTKALHITTRCKGHTLPGVLIDNGSALNVLPLFTLKRLPVDSSHMKTCQNIGRAFDATERKAVDSLGEAIRHRRIELKFITEGRLVTINVEEDIIASVTSDAPYVGTDDEAIECSFRSLEFVNATFIVERNKVPVPKISKTTKIGLLLTVGKGAVPRKGFGRNLQGRIKAPMLTDKQDRFGLGYKPDARQRKKEIEKKQERRRVRLNGEEVK
ncbi:uncharacterized protein LOC108451283 [Gossypium arboreum]|uniref:uncharacterized protein LOC108451283 n=1 Tax=Gossypium arboreum TaxID=29729 RepID=UPI0022F1A1BF|nr:uncharacterized protein LOC108451283 [Gossypium arboreum]